MASKARTARDAVNPAAIKALLALSEQPYAFDFFQALRWIECAHPDLPRLGSAARPAQEPVRLAQSPSLVFAPSTLNAFKPAAGNRPARLEVLFFGLFGPQGPLPIHLTEYTRERLYNHDDPTFARFADLFHHRLLALFYRAWASAEPAVHFDRPEADRFGTFLGSMFGLGAPALRKRDAAPDLAKLHYAGLLSCQPRHAEGLAVLLADFFSLPVRIVQFVGHWLQLDVRERTRLGDPRAPALLGRGAVIGERVWDYQHKFRIVIGPLDYADYQRLLPGGDSLSRLVALVRNYIDDGLRWDLQLVLKKDQIPAPELGRSGRLGWTAWSGRDQPHDDDCDDLLLDAQRYAYNADCNSGRAQRRSALARS